MAHHAAAVQLLHVFFFLPLLLLIHLRCSFAVGALATRNSSTIALHAPPNTRCLPHEAELLLNVKQSLSLAPDNPTTKKLLPSWRAGTDCCRHWEGVACDHAGRVTMLNLSYSDLVGDVPVQVAQLVNLVSLDLSNNFELRLHKPSFRTIIANLSSLKELHLDMVTISTTAVECSRALAKSVPRLEILSLSFCNLSGHIDDHLSSLRALTVMDLSGNSITHVPDSFARFQSLTHLDLSHNNLGTFPLGILQLRNIEFLSLSRTNISRCVIPYSIGNLTSLTELYLDDNSFSGGLPSTFSNLTSLRTLQCFRCGLSGEINVLANLTRLEHVDLSNNSFTGPIHFGDQVELIYLAYLDLSFSSLSQTIPPSLFTYPELKLLELRNNQFSGVLEEFSNPSSTLAYVFLSGNRLSGPVPSSFSRLASLQTLDISHNNFTGTLELFSYLALRNLALFYASNNNFLSVSWDAPNAENISSNISTSSWLHPYPSKADWRNVPQLDQLDLSWNHIRGEITSRIWSMIRMYLDLSHNMFTVVSQPPTNTSISHIDLSYNMLHGPVPLPAIAVYQDYSHNRFSSIPSSNFVHRFRGAVSIKLANNEISGPIPYVECHPSDTLQMMDLSNNNFSGPVPSNLLNCNSLKVLMLSGNNLSGSWPDNFKEGCSLQLIHLRENRITGGLPRSLTRCRELLALNIGHNFIVDSFPSWLGKLPKLGVLVLRSNKLYGSLPRPDENSTTGYFQKLQIVDLAKNMFSGALPRNLFQGSKLMTDPVGRGGDTLRAKIISTEFSSYLYQFVVDVAMKELYINLPKITDDFVLVDLSYNQFHGAIPKTIGKLSALLVLNMSGNAFTGEIPHEFGRLVQLESLDLSWNRLSGGIPQELATSLMSLESLDLSHNNLSGGIPSGPQFSTFNSSSFQGNSGLYGCPLPVQCNLLSGSSSKAPALPSAPSASKSNRDKFEVIMLYLFIGSGFGVGFAAAIVLMRVCSWGK